MKGLDLRNFQKVSSTAKHTVMEHPDGHQIKLDHSKLDKGMLKQLHALPFCGGGEVQHFKNGGDVKFEIPDSAEQHTIGFGSASGAATPIDMNAPARASDFSLNLPSSTPSQPEQPKQAPTNMPLPQQQQQVPAAMSMGAPTAGLDLQMAGLKNEAKESGALAQRQVGIQEAQSQQLQSLSQRAEQNTQQYDHEVGNVISDYKAGHIDPERFVKNMSTGGKISTAIGLILGGIGGGLTGQENPAMKFLNAQIQRDVEAQKADMDKQGTILHALNQQYGNKQDALKMLSAIYTAKTMSDLQEEALKSGNPLAMARAQQAMGPLLQQKQMLLQEMGMRQAVFQHIQSGAMDPAQAVPYLVPKEQQTKVYDSLGKIDELNKLRQNMTESWNHLNSEVGHGMLSPKDTASAKQAYAGAIERIFEGRYNENAAQKIVDSFLPQGPLESQTTRSNKLDRMNKFFDAGLAEHEAILKGNNIPVPQVHKSLTPGAGPKRR